MRNQYCGSQVERNCDERLFKGVAFLKSRLPHTSSIGDFIEEQTFRNIVSYHLVLRRQCVIVLLVKSHHLLRLFIVII